MAKKNFQYGSTHQDANWLRDAGKWAEKQASLLHTKYDPNQPRDEIGQWMDEGGGETPALNIIGGNVRFKKDSQGNIQGMPEKGLPKSFSLEGVDTSKAKLTPEEALKIESTLSIYAKIHIDEYLMRQRRGDIVIGAAQRVINDHNIRAQGKEIIAKYPGKDKATSQEIKAGEKVIYWRGDSNNEGGMVRP